MEPHCPYVFDVSPIIVDKVSCGNHNAQPSRRVEHQHKLHMHATSPIWQERRSFDPIRKDIVHRRVAILARLAYKNDRHVFGKDSQYPIDIVGVGGKNNQLDLIVLMSAPSVRDRIVGKLPSPFVQKSPTIARLV